MSGALERFGLKPRTWLVRCPDCLGRSTRTSGAWTATSIPCVVWSCPTCEGDGTVRVQRAANYLRKHFDLPAPQQSTDEEGKR